MKPDAPRKPLSSINSNVGSPIRSSGMPVCPSSSNSFSILAGNSEVLDKDAPIKRYSKPSFKVAEALNSEVEAVPKKNMPGTKGAGEKSKHTRCYSTNASLCLILISRLQGSICHRGIAASLSTLIFE